MLLKNAKNLFVGKETYYNGTIDLRPDDNAQIFFGNYCSIGKNLKIITTNHDFNFPCMQGKFYIKNFDISHPGTTNINPTKERTKGNVIIGHDVWIGDDVIILSGVKIGNGSIIGAGSVVTKNIDDYAIYAGVPAKFIKYRHNEQIRNFLTNLNWYEWDDNKIKKNKKFFISNINDMNIDELKKIIL
jgi:acetyltransferase-like isoleucine patch superfamily enzyme